MVVREAEPADAAAIEGLYRELVSNPSLRVTSDRIAQIRADPCNFLLVVDRAGAPVGTVFFTFCLDAMFGDAPYAIVEAVVVTAAARGSGVGRALLGEVEARARAARCTRIVLLSSLHRREAHAFFAEVGFDGGRKRGFVKYLGYPSPQL